MASEKRKREARMPTTLEATICFLVIVAAVVMTFKLKTGMEMPLVLATGLAALFGVYLGFDWNELQKGMIAGIASSIMAIVILLLAGMLVGIWIVGGTVPSIIYYGLKMVTPSIYLPFTFLICSLTSLATGTSFGSIATVGLALFGVGQGLGIPPHIAAGAIASGAFFGDKVSPLSDTTVISASICKVNIFEHVRATLWTTGPAALVALVLYAVVGMGYSSGTVDMASVDGIADTLAATFKITPLTLVPPAAIIVLSILKVPSVVALGSGVALSIATAVATQGIKVAPVLAAAVKGNSFKTGVALVDKILSRGGMSMMTGMIILFVVATAMSGILEKCGILRTMMDAALKVLKKPRDVILASLASGYLSQLLAPTMMFGIVFVGKTFAPAYEKLGIHPKVLSRTIGDTVTLGNVLIPYGGAAVFLMGVLGLENAAYIPYTFLCILSPIVAAVFAATGIGVWKAPAAESEAEAASA